MGMSFIEGCNQITKQKDNTTEAISSLTQEDKTLQQEQGIQNADTPDSNYWLQKFLDSIGEDEYIIENSDIQPISYDVFSYMGSDQLDYALHEIYARHGYVFEQPEYQKYFESKTWYQPVQDNSLITLNETEQYNVKLIEFLIQQIEQRNYNYANESVSSKDIYEANQEIHCDVNGDGKKEKIIYTLSPLDRDEDFLKTTLCINNEMLEIEGMNLRDQKFAIVDISTEDDYKEILISKHGFDMHYTTDYFIFKDNKIIKIGETEGLINEGIKLNGDGTLTARSRTDFLHTWHYPQKYYLDSNHQLLLMPEEFYEDNIPLFLQQTFEFYKEQDITSEKFEVQPGEVIILVESDLKEWVKIKTKDGQNGWFRVIDADHTTAAKTEDGRLIQDVFAGLFFAG